MRKAIFVFVSLILCSVMAGSGVASKNRSATLVDNTGAAWKIRDVFISAEPGGFYESRFCLTIATETFRVAIPPENLISVEVMGENCQIVYQWMGARQTTSGRVAWRQIGGKSDVGYIHLDSKKTKKLTFEAPPHGNKWEKPISFDTTLVLTNGARVPVANLIRVSSKPYRAVPLSGTDAGCVFDIYNDVGFLRGETAPTIKLNDVTSMEFPTKDTILFRLKQEVNDILSEGENNENSGRGKNEVKSDEDFLREALKELGQDKSYTGKPLSKNWAYGFTGIYHKGYFFIYGRHVKSIEFGTK